MGDGELFGTTEMETRNFLKSILPHAKIKIELKIVKPVNAKEC
jgi:hypothetical protein